MPITAFVSRGWSKLQPKHVSETRWSIRWFTSTIEYPLCGHASLAASKLILTQLLKRTSDEETEATVEFETRTKGVLSATISWLTGLVNLNFPSNSPTQLLRNDNKWIDSLISNTLGPNVSAALVEDIQYSLATSILVLVLKNDSKESNETFLRTLKPNFPELTAPDTGKLVLKPLMVVATVKGTADGPHFYSRVFCPSIGYNEDHACG
jgi:predicted PhzF superfamily epimerase YddE/YHI9